MSGGLVLRYQSQHIGIGHGFGISRNNQSYPKTYYYGFSHSNPNPTLRWRCPNLIITHASSLSGSGAQYSAPGAFPSFLLHTYFLFFSFLFDPSFLPFPVQIVLFYFFNKILLFLVFCNNVEYSQNIAQKIILLINLTNYRKC